jgi:FkbM family methyltransferase
MRKQGVKKQWGSSLLFAMLSNMKLFKRQKLHKTFAGKLAGILKQAGVTVVFDIGANVGQTYDELRKGGYMGRIISVEPTPAAHETLLKRAEKDDLWEIAPRQAVGAKAGEALLNVTQASDLNSLLPPAEALLVALPKAHVTEQVATPVVTVADLVAQYTDKEDVIFVKMDTQGFERPVLQGAKKVMQRLVGFQLELSLVPLYEGEETYLSFLQDLHQWGYEPFMMTENYFSRKQGRQLQIDVVFMRV